MTTIVVLFEADPELEAEHLPTEHAPGRPSCSCGWVAIPEGKGQAAEVAALLAHRRESSRRRVTIEADYYLAWSDQFGTGQFIADGDTGDRIDGVLKAHGTDGTA